jgi:YwiC-like protein
MRRPGWVPVQHGAWAMLAVPFAAGLLLRLRDAVGAAPWLAALFACWLIGYFAFNAASTWLKAAPERRPAFVAPLVTYAAASGAFGLLTLAFAGVGILSWVPLYAVLLVPALALAARRRERATIGGALTTAAASVMTLVVRFPMASDVVAWTPQVRSAVVVAALVFAYFFGTVLYVKTNIRERGSVAFYRASVGWHAGWTALAALGIALGVTPAWTLLFAAATVRAAAAPRLRPRLSPRTIGLFEAAFCVAALLIVGLA